MSQFARCWASWLWPSSVNKHAWRFAMRNWSGSLSGRCGPIILSRAGPRLFRCRVLTFFYWTLWKFRWDGIVGMAPEAGASDGTGGAALAFGALLRLRNRHVVNSVRAR